MTYLVSYQVLLFLQEALRIIFLQGEGLSMSSKEQLFFKITHSTQNYSITL